MQINGTNPSFFLLIVSVKPRMLKLEDSPVANKERKEVQ
jgi:hypothetical protein